MITASEQYQHVSGQLIGVVEAVLPRRGYSQENPQRTSNRL